jgi:hypothetical protein
MKTSLVNENASDFLQLREVRLNELTANFLISKTEVSFEDTPPLSSFILDEEEEEDLVEEDLADGCN